MSEQTHGEELAFPEIPYRISELAQALLDHPDEAVAAQVSELLDWYDLFHRDGLGQLIDMIRTWRGEIFLESVGRDALAGTLLDFYDLGENPEVDAEAEKAVAAALEEVRPIVESHGGELEVTSIADGVVKVRMKGTCDGCPSSSATLTYGVEAALREGWPNFRRMEVLEGEATSINQDAAELECVTVPGGVPEPAPAPQGPLLQIRRKT